MNILKQETWHRDYNLTQKHNLDSVPEEPAVFALFGILDNEPVNCRYVSTSKNLRADVTQLFENPHSTGLKMFMQGPWIKWMQYQVFRNTPAEEMQRIAEEWTRQYQPSIDDEGEYNGPGSEN